MKTYTMVHKERTFTFEFDRNKGTLDEFKVKLLKRMGNVYRPDYKLKVRVWKAGNYKQLFEAFKQGPWTLSER